MLALPQVTTETLPIFGLGFGVGIILGLLFLSVAWWQGWKMGLSDRRIYMEATRIKRNQTLDPSATLTPEDINKLAGG